VNDQGMAVPNNSTEGDKSRKKISGWPCRTGDTWTPTIMNLFVFWLWELPLAYVLAVRFHFGPRGVFLAITVAFSTLAIVSAIFFRRGKKPAEGWPK
jgi:hypothetical protein